MTPRQRTLEALLYGKPDRIPLTPGAGRKSTRERWYSEGLPREVQDIAQYAYRQAGGTMEWPVGGPGLNPRERMIPEFEEKIIERKERSLIVQDWKGNICEISDEFGVEYLRSAIDFVTRRWVKCPVESWGDWEEMKKRYDPADPARFPANPAQLGAQLKQRDYYVGFSFSGPFWQLREWLGFEQLCVLFYDNPKLAEAMLDFWKEYVGELLRRGFEYVIPDEVHISEDMAYKQFSMISPEMCRKHLMPVWKYWGEIIHGAGVPVFACDSDGFVGQLIPLWIESGINVCDPIEVAAGNDLVAFHREYGRDMGYRGGVDKRAMAKGGQVLADELERLRPVIEGGGYIPSCDHGIPSDVSWPNFVDYVGRLAKLTGWM